MISGVHKTATSVSSVRFKGIYKITNYRDAWSKREQVIQGQDLLEKIESNPQLTKVLVGLQSLTRQINYGFAVRRAIEQFITGDSTDSETNSRLVLVGQANSSNPDLVQDAFYIDGEDYRKLEEAKVKKFGPNHNKAAVRTLDNGSTFVHMGMLSLTIPFDEAFCRQQYLKSKQERKDIEIQIQSTDNQTLQPTDITLTLS
jgi:hypothetical protein